MKKTLLIATILISISTSAQYVNLGNRIWWDYNDNGKYESNEPPATGVGVYLFQDNDDDGIADAGFSTRSTTTNWQGKYYFYDVPAGKYFIKVDAGYSHFMSTRKGGDPDNNIDDDSNGDRQDIVSYYIYTQTIELQPGTEADGTGATNTNSNYTLDCGMWKANGLGDMVWLDNNGNGIQETGEPGLPNVTVHLKNSAGNILETTTTDANGNFFFHNPMNYGTNEYQVEFVTPSGYKPTLSNRGGDEEKDSDVLNGIATSIIVPFGTWDHSIDAGFVPSSTLLPLKILSFNAMLIDNKVDLKWVTSSEVNVSHFIIEKSFDSKTYFSAGIVFAKNNVSEENTYDYADNIAATNAKVIYYRLRTLDNDGTEKISAVRIIKLSKQDEAGLVITTYPNPVANELRITMPAEWQSKQAKIEIFNASGNSVKVLNTARVSQTETISVSSLSPGFYFIRATCNGTTAQQKIIKQ